MVSEKQPLLERFKYPIFLLIVVALMAGIAALLLNRPDPTVITVLPPEPTVIPSITFTPAPSPTPGPYLVYVTGAVASPGLLVTLEYGSRVVHALDAVGGPAEDADLDRVNLAQLVEDGDQITVPTRAGSAVVSTAVIRIVTATPGNYTIYVTGEVIHPQSLVSVPIGSLVQDAIDAAGGATDNADLSQLNLSQRLNDGDLVYVPSLAEQADAVITPTPNHPPLVHINYATVEELDALPGIGPSLAQAIIDYRTQNGPFTSIDELDNVPGIGPSKLDTIRDLIVID